MTTRAIGLLAKFWEPGRVKTRLGAVVGHDRAAEIARVFLQTTLERLMTCDAALTLFYAPQHRREAFAELVPTRWTLEPQPNGDLGQRLEHALQRAQRSGPTQVVLVGADSPTLPLAYLEQAFAVLDRCDAVLGPTCDGGYYLVGASRQDPPLFRGMPWSTSDLWQASCQTLDRTGWSWQALPAWYDVDEWADLQRLLEELHAVRTLEPALRRLRDALVAIMATD
jgi:rSAM/selenodomain-associated transferase 1